MFYNYDIDQVLRENFNVSDRATRKYLASLEEEDKSAVTTALASALYDKIVNNVDKIDFGTIPKSMGDITKIDGYENTVECLDIIKKLVIQYKESTECVDTVINAVENIKARKSLFMKGFALKSSLPMNLYNLIVLSIEHSVSFLITVCIEYIKNPETGTISMAIDKVSYNNAHDNMLFEQLRTFNTSCGNGELDACLTEVLKAKPVKEDAEPVPATYAPSQPVYTLSGDGDGSELFSGDYDENEPLTIAPVIPENDDPDTDSEEPEENKDVEVDYDFSEDDSKPSFEVPVVTNEFGIGTVLTIGGLALGGGALALKGAVYIVKVLIPKLRNISYFFIHSKVRTSDNLAIQAQLIELNAYEVKYNEDIDPAKREKIVRKQLKVAETLRKWSNKFAIDNKKAENDAKKEMSNDDKKLDIGDVTNTDSGDIF